MANTAVVDVTLLMRFPNQSYSNSNFVLNITDEKVYNFADMISKYQVEPAEEIIKTVKSMFILN